MLTADLDDGDLIRLYRGGDRQARATLIERYLPLARSLALRYRSSGEPIDDLIQVASLGLVKAADRWEPGRGFAFTSLAVPTILGELRHYFRDSTWDVRPPRSLTELAHAVDRARGPVGAALGREPTLQDLAAHLGRSPETIAAATRAAEFRRLRSLDAPANAEAHDQTTLGELVDGEDRGLEHAEGRIMFEHLTRALERRARAVVRLSVEHDLPQHRIAPLVGYSQVHVSRLLQGALQTLNEAAPAAR